MNNETNQSRLPLVFILAVACAVSVANLYYNQPLLVLMARTFPASAAAVGIVPTVTQIGYAAGLFFLVPLGDVLEGRRLIILTTIGVTLSLAAVAAAPSLPLLAVLSFFVGVTTVIPQMLIPFGVRLSAPENRGKTVGAIMSGLLLGILLSRTFAGFVGGWWGWRAVYGIAAALMAVLIVVLRALLPENPPAHRLSYPALLRSVVALARRHAALREASLSGALLFATFSVFWSTLGFELAAPPFHLGAQAAGLFGLVGAVGALAAPLAGRFADRNSPRFLIGLAAATVLLSYMVFGASGHPSLLALVIGVILLDLGVQSAQVTNQTRVYKLDPAAASRLNTVYMTTYFVGGALGSFFANVGWRAGGWPGVCIAGGSFAILAVLLNAAAGALNRQRSE